jgi:hypothetical protein
LTRYNEVFKIAPAVTIATTTFDKKSGNVVTSVDDKTDTKTIAHELKHQSQFERGTASLPWTGERAQFLIYDKSDEFEGEKRGSLFGQGVHKFSKLSILYFKSNQPEGPLDIKNSPDFIFLNNNSPSDIKEKTINGIMRVTRNAIRLSVDGDPKSKKTYSGQ